MCAGGVFTQELSNRNTFLLYALAAAATSEEEIGKVCMLQVMRKLYVT
jgi:hypothetical protein